MKKSILILIGLGLLVAVGGFLLIQLVPYGHNHTNPPVVQEPNWDSQQTRDLAVRACFDCHSNQSTWPWYSNIAPISWLVQHDVDEGRRRLNFSDWNNVNPRRLQEIGRVVVGGEMPPGIYMLEHPSAKLSAAEKQQLSSGLTATASNP